MTVKELLKSLPLCVSDLELKMDVGESHYQPLAHVLKVTNNEGFDEIILFPEDYHHD